MSKKRKQKPARKKVTVQERLGTLKWHYQLGQDILAVDAEFHHENPDAIFSTGVCQNFAKKERVCRTTTDVARIFAARYSQDEFQELCSLRRKKDNLPLGRAHIHILVGVLDRKVRKALQKAAAEKSWSVAALRQEIKKRVGYTKYGGRRRRPETVEDALQQIVDMAGQWLRWYEDLTAKEPPKEVKVRLAMLPKSLHEPLANMTVAAQAVQDKADRRLRSQYPERTVIQAEAVTRRQLFEAVTRGLER